MVENDKTYHYINDVPLEECYLIRCLMVLEFHKYGELVTIFQITTFYVHGGVPISPNSSSTR